MLERARALADWLVRPLARLLLALRVPPDAVTWAGTILVCLTAVITIPAGWLWQGALIIGVLSLSDTLDGAMARLAGEQRTWGAFLDSSLDRVADGFLFGSVLIHLALMPGYGSVAEPFVLYEDTQTDGPYSSSLEITLDPGTTFLFAWPTLLALLVLVLGQLTSYVKARAESLGGEGGGGPGARADRIVIILLALVLEGLGVPHALSLGLGVLAVLGVITVAIRMRRAKLSFDSVGDNLA